MSADETSDEKDHRQARGMDPAIGWALGPGKHRFLCHGRQQEWMPVLLRLNGVGARDFASGAFIDDAERRKRWRDSVRVSPLYTESPAADAAPYCTAMVQEDFFDLVRRDARVRAVVDGVTLGLPLDAESLPPDGGKTMPGKDRP